MLASLLQVLSEVAVRVTGSPARRAHGYRPHVMELGEMPCCLAVLAYTFWQCWASLTSRPCLARFLKTTYLATSAMGHIMNSGPSDRTWISQATSTFYIVR